MFQLQLLHWHAWSSSLTTHDTWRSWDGTPKSPKDNHEHEAPDVSFVPAGTRRRLSLLSKMALHVAHHALQGSQTSHLRTVFASRHGELQRTAKLLEAIAAQRPVSPTQFSLSVHNTPASLHHITTKNTQATTSLAAGPDTFLAAWQEAVGWLSYHPKKPLLLVVADDVLPDVYMPFQDEQQQAYGMAFVLQVAETEAPKEGLSLLFGPQEGSKGAAAPNSPPKAPNSPPKAPNDPKWPQGFRFIRWLVGETPHFSLDATSGTRWCWQRGGVDG